VRHLGHLCGEKFDHDDHKGLHKGTQRNSTEFLLINFYDNILIVLYLIISMIKEP